MSGYHWAPCRVGALWGWGAAAELRSSPGPTSQIAASAETGREPVYPRASIELKGHGGDPPAVSFHKCCSEVCPMWCCARPVVPGLLVLSGWSENHPEHVGQRGLQLSPDLFWGVRGGAEI